MKTKVIFILVLTCATYLASAQKAGIKFGANFTNLYIDDVDDENMKVGFQLGGYYRADLSNNFSLQPEFLFSQKGSEVVYNGTIFNESGKYRFNLNYLEVPVLFVGRINNFNLQFGPYVGILVGANIKNVNNTGQIQDIESLDRDSFNTLDTGFSGGLGFDFTGGTMGIRYSYGFGEIGRSESAGQATPDSKNSALQFFVGFDF